MYVLNYTIISAGLPYQSEGVDHQDALMKFIRYPSHYSGYHRGRLDVDDGERIHVVGPTQDDYAAHMRYHSSLSNARERVAAGGAGVREAQKRLKMLEANPVPAPQQVTIEFVMCARTVFDAVEVSDVERIEENITNLRGKIEEMAAKGPIRLVVNFERQFPIGNKLVGVPEEMDNDGVWLHGSLIPWADIEGAIPEDEKVTA